MSKRQPKDPKLVTEKQESAGTVAKAGAFWAVLAAIPLVARALRKRQQRKKRHPRRFFRR